MSDRALDRVALWTLAAGAATGAAALAFGALRRRRREREEMRIDNDLDALEVAVVEALRRDPVTGGYAIDVAVVAPGLVELSGTVASREVAQRAARLLHAVGGVRTVVNRMVVGVLEEHLAENRERHQRNASDAPDRQADNDVIEVTPVHHAAAQNTVM